LAYTDLANARFYPLLKHVLSRRRKWASWPQVSPEQYRRSRVPHTASNFYAREQGWINDAVDRNTMYSHCTTGGWILGNKIEGTQAEFVRISHADTSL
jgi:hypothetical protein